MKKTNQEIKILEKFELCLMIYDIIGMTCLTWPFEM